MPEAITKYAVNSTLGTDDFKPLDKIFLDNMVIVASDIPLKSLETSGQFSGTGKKYSFSANLSGTIRIKMDITSGNEQDVYIYCKNSSNNIISEKSRTISKGEVFYIDVNINKKENYTIGYEGSTSVFFENLSICGQTIYGNPIV